MRPSDTGTRARDILPYATATAPTQLLNEHAVNVLTDTISDLRTLARAGSAHGGGNAVEEAGSDVIIEDPGEGNQRWGGGSNGGSARGMDDWMMGMECGDGRDGRSNDGVVRLKKQIQAELRGLIDEKEVEGMWEFWAGEWVVE